MNTDEVLANTDNQKLHSPQLSTPRIGCLAASLD